MSGRSGADQAGFLPPKMCVWGTPFSKDARLFQSSSGTSARIVKAIDVLAIVSSASWRMRWGLRHIISASMVLKPGCRSFTTVAFAAHRALEAVLGTRALGCRESNVGSRDPRGGGRFEENWLA
ncbi:hypothetical protein [Tritonibacter scottomollicae]|uniref:hypothetical protein n=1 Tax=Tritonibacter scottomollicae TaxID=483013 RepID=UPI003AA803E9